MAHLSWFILILIFYQKLPNWLDSKYNDSSVFKIYISGSSWKINDRSWNIKFAENDNIIIDKKNDSKHGKEILTKRNEDQIEIKINQTTYWEIDTKLLTYLINFHEPNKEA